MSTRSIIAVRTPNEDSHFRGVYHHSDGYPSGVGQHLYHLAQTALDDLESLTSLIIDDHPEGWSHLIYWNGDPDTVIGYDEAEQREQPYIKESNWDDLYRDRVWGVFYDGVRAPDDLRFFNRYNTPTSWAEYLYEFDLEAKTLIVSRVDLALSPLMVIDLTAPEPTWID